MTEPTYVPYRRVGMKLKPLGVTTDFPSVQKLRENGQADGYIAGKMVSFEKEDHLLDSDLGSLSWRDADRTAGTGTRVRNALRKHLQERYGRRPDYAPTVRDVVDLFNTAATERCLVIRNFGGRSYSITREVFRRAGIDLPEVKI